jgi:hypothetical protein
MKNFSFAVAIVMTVALTGCSSTKKGSTVNGTAANENVQTQNLDKDAFTKAAGLTSGWPDSSITAAKEMISKYGDPQETTSTSLIWRNIAPFKRIIVHKEVYNHRFPLLHQNALEHVVNYKAKPEKIDDVWKYNGSIVLDRTKGEMSSFAENEAMNILALNLAHDVLSSRMSADAARVTYGKETISFLNGNKTENTQVLKFGSQYETADPGETVATKIRWIGDPANKKQPSQNINLRQAQEDKK